MSRTDDVKAANGSGATPLSLPATAGHTEVADLLRQHGAKSFPMPRGRHETRRRRDVAAPSKPELSHEAAEAPFLQFPDVIAEGRIVGVRGEDMRLTAS